MKIIATIIRNGISLGIPEGTKMPEKPEHHKENRSDLREYFSQSPENKAAEEKYQLDLKALWDASMEFEDQGEAWELMEPHLKPIRERFAKERQVSESQIASYGVDVDFIKHEGGIYPLKGVNAERVWKYRFKASNGMAASEWFDVKPEMKVWSQTNLEYLEVLRLIPQPNSALLSKEQELQIDKLIADIPENERKELEFERNKVEVTEVSEPTCFRMNGTEYTCEIICDECKAKVGGVSEGEPNQEELFTELIMMIQGMEVVDAIEYAKERYNLTRKP